MCEDKGCGAVGLKPSGGHSLSSNAQYFSRGVDVTAPSGINRLYEISGVHHGNPVHRESFRRCSEQPR